MPSGPVGTVWATDSWSGTCWEAGVWSDVAPIVRLPDNIIVATQRVDEIARTVDASLNHAVTVVSVARTVRFDG